MQGNDPLLADAYAVLREMASGTLERRGVVSLTPTELVHEAWLRLAHHGFEGLSHYKAVAALAMRQLIADRARAQQALKRQPPTQVTLVEDHIAIDALALHQALDQMERQATRTYQVVCMRYLAGMTIPETAMALGVSERTVQTEWRVGRIWLVERLKA